MARNTSITLGPHFDDFIAAQLEMAAMALQAKWYEQDCACLKRPKANLKDCGASWMKASKVG